MSINNISPPPIDNDPPPSTEEGKKKLQQFISKNTWGAFKTWLSLQVTAVLNQILQAITFDGNKGLGSINGLPATPGMAQLLGSGQNQNIGGFPGTNPNLLRRSINGSFNSAQLPAVSVVSGGPAGYGGPDHFVGVNSAGGTFSQSQNSFINSNVNHKCVLQQVTSVMTNNAGSNFWSGVLQSYEGYQVYDMIGSPMSVSFWVNTNWTGNLTVAVNLNRSPVFSYVTVIPVVANIPRYVAITTPPIPVTAVAVPDNAVAMQVWIGASNAGTFQTASLNGWISGQFITASTYTNWCTTLNNFIAVSEYQMQKGPVTPFERWEFGYEYQQCLRYVNAFGGQAPLIRGVTAGAISSRCGMALAVPMRSTAVAHNIAGLIVYDGSVTNSIASINTDYSGSFEIEYDLNMNAAWPVASRPAILFQQTSSFYLLSELV